VFIRKKLPELLWLLHMLGVHAICKAQPSICVCTALTLPDKEHHFSSTSESVFDKLGGKEGERKGGEGEEGKE
jgi:hypothetical protein